MNNSIFDSILENSENCNEELKSFIKQFYTYLSDAHKEKSGMLLCIARDLYDFISIRKPNEDKIRIFRPTVKKNGWQSSFTIVEIATEDKPFLVDSVTEALKANGHVIRDRINSVINRKVSGKKILESIMHFSVTHMSETEMLTLTSNLKKVLKMVRCCVESWHQMLTEVDNITKKVISSPCALKESKEIVAFLQWLKKDNFVFLGYAEYNWNENNEIVREDGTLIGIPQIDKALYDLGVNQESKDTIYITRSDRVSKVHRHVNMDCIGIKKYDTQGNIIGEMRLLGLFTSIVYYQDVRLIPIIREKITNVEKRFNFLKGSHNHKSLITVLQDFPRAELLHIPIDELFTSCTGILSLSVRPEVKLFVHQDKVGRFVRSIIFLPRNQFSSALWLRMQKVLAHAFEGKVINEQIRDSDSGLIRLQLILKVEKSTDNMDIQNLECKLKTLARDWKDNLRDVLEERYDSITANRLYKYYEHSFPLSYQETFKAVAAFYDIKRIDIVRTNNDIESDLYGGTNGAYQLKIYVPQHKIELFDMLPVIDNMEMKVTNHYSYRVHCQDNFTITIHHFLLAVNPANILPINEIKTPFELTLHKIWNKEIEDDYYNSLVLAAGLSWREILLIRAWSRYLKQIRFDYGEVYIQQALSNHTDIVFLLIKLFHVRLDPELFNDNTTRAEAVSEICSELEQSLGEIDSLAEDKIIRALIEINMSILRTNYYYDKKYIAFKIDSSKICALPLPKPFVEIYVYSHEFEAIHLRGGKVARGGLRWSDRTEDFRTEVLGLMKAQMPKNTVIVPVGSKGGFIVKLDDKNHQNVVYCYQNFLRAMLDITDNIQDGASVQPDNMVIYDDNDPYLVVAADKGTATFSDYANAVAEEYNFWLGDAFASGGSSGYDHKAISITSKGAWVAMQNHLWAIGKDHNQALRFIGIGDMSGDVFGNGLLQSKKIKLIMAFNHLHIFIDPDPDVNASFIERKRLFKLPGSKWTDYDKKLISEGGGIFYRSAKSIKISPQMKEIFDITEDTLNPNELIHQGLQASVDVIWNGGIGTFVKSSHENNDIVGDKSNDAIRVNGKQIKAQMVIEGGNLGCTQLGRIEYARNGGYINTDFIDNSAGVTCSDMEVNIKIALLGAVKNKQITIKQRNQLLKDMTAEVIDIILYGTNLLQVKGLIIAKLQAKRKLEQYHRLIKSLEREQKLDRTVEFIPSEDDFNHMYASKTALSIPEIAVVVAYAKMNLYEQLLSSDVPDNEYLNLYLKHYFPHGMQKQFNEEIMHHRLKREIISTQIVNSIINRMGCTFIPDLMEYTGAPASEIVKIYISVYYSYGLDRLWSIIDNLNDKIDVNIYLEIVTEIHKFIEGVVHWFIRNYPKPINIQLTIAEFSKNITIITDNIHQILDEKSLDVYNDKLNNFMSYHLPKDLSKKIASLQFVSSVVSITQVANNLRFYGKRQVSLLIIAKIYFILGCRLHFTWLKKSAFKVGAGSYWQRLSMKTLFDDLQDQQMVIAEQVSKEIKEGEDYTQTVNRWFKLHNRVIIRYNNILGDVKASKELDLGKLIIIIKCLGEVDR